MELVMKFMECFIESLKLGLTSFGGPVAHLAYFREAYVERLKWLSDSKYAELLAICQFMPGPASSQLGASIGYHRGGWLGGLGAWLGFTLPSAILLILLGSGLETITGWVGSGWIHGLKVVAVGVVCMAIYGMQKKLCPEWKTMAIALIVAALLILFPLGWLQPVLILLGGVVGAVVFSAPDEGDKKLEKKKFPMASVMGLIVFLIALICLIVTPVVGKDMTMVSGLLKTGAMVFGGGHVVMPLLETQMVGTQLMTHEQFLAGYGAAQAVPGPMFTLSAYLGAQMPLFGNSWVGGFIAVGCIFLPGMILLALGMPLWNRFKDQSKVRGGLRGANAAVVGLLIAALVIIIRAGALHGWLDIVLALAVFGILMSKKAPVWLVVILGAVFGGFVY